MTTKLLSIFNQINRSELNNKDEIVARLLNRGHITPSEATVLLKTIDITLNAESLEMSSGAKIVGGSDFETTDFGRR